MKKIDITPFSNADTNNNGKNREFAVCRYFGIERYTHDRTAYNKGSDVEIDGRNISVKSAGFTLMHGNLCKGCKTFEGIWRRYYREVHSDEWLYVTKDWQGFLMNKKEFSQFVHKFCTIDRESTKNGGHIKIKNSSETKAMRKWLEEKCA